MEFWNLKYLLTSWSCIKKSRDLANFLILIIEHVQTPIKNNSLEKYRKAKLFFCRNTIWFNTSQKDRGEYWSAEGILQVILFQNANLSCQHGLCGCVSLNIVV